MQYKDEKTSYLIKSFGELVNEIRLSKTDKSLTLFSYENDLDPGNVSRIENGQIETKLTMLWRIAEGLNIPLSVLIKKLEDKLGKNFNLIEK